MYTKIQVSEEIAVTLRSLYSIDNAPDIERSTLKMLLKLAVTKVHFKSNDNWYCQKDGLAMDESLAVVLANIWMKSYEKLSDINQTQSVRIKDFIEKCRDCHRKNFWNSKAVECE